MINSVSRAKINPMDDNYIISRNYLQVLIWDVRNNKQPCKVFNVNDYMERKLCDVYETETIFDKFDL